MKSDLHNWLLRLEQMQPDKIELGLDRIKRVAVACGLDSPPFRIITVAGTNGKGSTVAYCDAILSELGYRTGVYTSPHFVDFNERIVVDNKRADESLLCEAFDAIDGARNDVALTYFEFTTLAAIYCFTSAKVDVAILEVGLGGRLDAVNAWDSEVACISSIGIDHIDWLGDDRESIGVEKAGVARAGCALVCGDTDPPASIAATVNDIGAQLVQRGRDFHVERVGDDQWRYKDVSQNMVLPLPKIAGDWPCDNAAVAICSVGHFLGHMPSQSSIEKAMDTVTMTGRMQMFNVENVTGNSIQIIVDVAHNAAAADKLSKFLNDHPTKGVTRAVFACMQDKDIAAIIASLHERIDHWYIAEIDYPRAMQTGDIQHEILQHGQIETEIFTSVTEATGAAVAQSTGSDRVVVFGSFHVVGPALAVLT